MAPQFSREQRNFLVMEYHKRKGHRDILPQLITDFQNRFPGVRAPSFSAIRRVWKKQMMNGTVNNCNSSSSPGVSHSGRPRTARTPGNIVLVRDRMNRDSVKQIGDGNVSPVSTTRKNSLQLSKSSWCRISKDLKYHPYKPVRRHELINADYARRRAFCNWLLTRTDQELQKFLFSDEANFELSGYVNSQNVRRYSPLKSADPVHGGRPAHFVVDKPTNSTKLMVFCGLKSDGSFGLKFYRGETMNGDRYHSLLQYHVLPELRHWNGGSLATLVWQQDGAPCHVTNRNMRYLDSQFGDRVVSRNSIQGRDWPARSPDLNPLDYFLWGYLKSKVYSPWPRNLDDLETNIRREVRNLQPAMIRRAIMEIKVRAQKCLNARGGHFEC